MKKIIFSILAMTCITQIMLAQDGISTPQKVKFINNFVLFTNWPQDSSLHNPADTLTIGVYDEGTAFASAMQQTFSGEKINDFPVRIKKISKLDALKNTENLILLYISDVEKNTLQNILNYTREKPILTVGGKNGLEKDGVIITLKSDRQKPGFIINQKEAHESGLRFKYQLYQQGKIINKVNR